MATTISKLAVAVTARTSKFNSAMKAAEKHTRSFQRMADKAARRVALLGAVTSGVAAAGMVKLTKDSLASIDATAKFADRVGIATEKLTGLEHAASIYGATAKDLHTGLLRMARTIGDAGDESADAVRAFDKLGLSYEHLIDLDPERQFMAIADAISTVDNATIRADLAQTIFGKGGASLINVLSQGSSEIRRLQTDAARLGLTFSRFDASKVEEANDAMTRLAAALRGAGNEAAIGLSPAIEQAANSLTNLIANNDLEHFFTRVGNAGIEAMDALANGSIYASLSLDILREKLNLLEQSFLENVVERSINNAAKQTGLIDLRLAEVGAVGGNLVGVISDAEKRAIQDASKLASGNTGALSNPYRLPSQRFGDGQSFDRAVDSLHSDRLLTLQRELKEIEASKMNTALELEDSYASLKRVRQRAMVERKRELMNTNTIAEVADALSGVDSSLASILSRVDAIDRAGKSPFEKWQEDSLALQKAFEAGAIQLDRYMDSQFMLSNQFRSTLDTLGPTADGPGEFRQVILENVALNGIRNVGNAAQEIQSKQLDETNQKLDRMVDLLAVPRAAVLG
ncbi:MAG: hypothetical protein Phyf2KO_00690 [Phycisphaerales bacterium]